MQLRAFKMWLSIVMNSKSFYMWYPSHYDILKKIVSRHIIERELLFNVWENMLKLWQLFHKVWNIDIDNVSFKNIFSKIKILGLAQDPKSLQLLAGLVEAAMKSPLKGKLKA